MKLCALGQDLDDEYEAALERRRLEVESERRLQEEEDARLLRALTAQQELPGECQSAMCSKQLRQAALSQVHTQRLQGPASGAGFRASHAPSKATHHMWL